MPVGGRGEVALLGAVLQRHGRARSAAREEELRVASDRLQGILEHATALMSIKDVDGRYLVVGRAWARGDGHDDERRASAAPTPSSCPAADAAPSRAADLQVIRTGEVLEYEREAITPTARALHDRQVPAQGRGRRASTPSRRWPPT